MWQFRSTVNSGTASADAASLGSAVESIRKASGQTQAELAAWVGADRGLIRRIEHGDLAVLERLLKMIGMSGYDLIVVPRGSQVIVD